MKRPTIIFVCFGFIFLVVASARAQAEAYTKDVTYKTCELDSAFSSQVIAKEQVKQRIFDELADISEDWSKKYKSFTFSRESGIPMFSCLINIEAVEEKRDDGSLYYKAEAKTQLAKVLENIGLLKDGEYPITDIIANRAVANQALREIEQIKAEVAASGNKDDKQATYDGAVNRLHAADWYEKASLSLFSEEFDQAIDAYTKAIEYNPRLVIAYQKRAGLYHRHLKDDAKAATDIWRASRVYYDRGIDSLHSKNYQECLENLDNSIKLYTKDAEAHYHRAACKIGLGNPDKVKEDFVTAAKLGHKEAQALLTRKGIPW